MTRMRGAALLLIMLMLMACQPGEGSPINLAYPAPGTAPSMPPVAGESPTQTAATPTATLAVASSSPTPTTASNEASQGLVLEGLHMSDKDYGWAWTYPSHLFRTTDGGSTWTTIESKERLDPDAGAFVGKMDAWVPGQGADYNRSPIFHTSDGGQTWEQLAALGPSPRVFFHDAQNGWALAGTGGTGNYFYGAYQTHDGGSTWAALHGNRPDAAKRGLDPFTIHVGSGDLISFSLPETIWISPSMLDRLGPTVSWDGGKTWIQQDPGMPEDPRIKAEFIADVYTVGAPQFVSDRDGFLPVVGGFTGYTMVVYATHDAGRTWKALPAILDSSTTFPRVQFLSRLDGFAVCGFALCITYDGGMTWQRLVGNFEELNGRTAWQLQFVDARTGWALVDDSARRNILIKTEDGGFTWYPVEPQLK